MYTKIQKRYAGWNDLANKLSSETITFEDDIATYLRCGHLSREEVYCLAVRNGTGQHAVY
jgi:hypothetical protein